MMKRRTFLIGSAGGSGLRPEALAPFEADHSFGIIQAPPGSGLSEGLDTPTVVNRQVFVTGLQEDVEIRPFQ